MYLNNEESDALLIIFIHLHILTRNIFINNKEILYMMKLESIITKYLVISPEGEIIKLTRAGKNAKVIEIPSEVDGVDIISIGKFAFAHAKNLIKVVIPKGVFGIGFGAFTNCINLKDIIFPDHNIVINDFAFQGCESLEEVTIPDTISIGAYAFANCHNLSKVTLNYGTLYIDNWAFSRCEKLTHINIPDTLNVIGYAAFSYTNIRKIEYSGTADKFRKISGWVGSRLVSHNPTIVYKSEYADSPARYFIVNDEGVITSLSEEGMNASRINIPKRINGIDIVGLGYGVFYGSNMNTLYIQDNITSISTSMCYGCTNLTNVTLPNTIDTLPEFAFEGCKKLKSIIIPKTVKNIGFAVFKDCESLEEVIVQDDIDCLYRHVFLNCPLKSITYKKDDGSNCHIMIIENNF